MMQIKIFKDGEERECVDCDLLVFAGFKDAEDSTDFTSGIVGTRVSKQAVANGLAEVVASAISEITERDTFEELLLTRNFLNTFAKCILRENHEPETAKEGE